MQLLPLPTVALVMVDVMNWMSQVVDRGTDLLSDG